MNLKDSKGRFMNIKILGLSVLIASGSFFGACSSELDCTTTETPTFTTLNTNIFTVSCSTSECHDSTSPAGSYDMTTYAGVMDNVTASDLASALYTNVLSDAMPQGGPALSDAQKCQINKWIAAGAPND